jgi:hypothetical protein
MIYPCAVKTPAKQPRRAKRTRKDPQGLSGVSSAQKVLAALLEKHDPPAKK